MDQQKSLEQLTEALTDVAYQHDLESKSRLSVVLDGKTLLTFTVRALMERSRKKYLESRFEGRE